MKKFDYFRKKYSKEMDNDKCDKTQNYDYINPDITVIIQKLKNEISSITDEIVKNTISAFEDSDTDNKRQKELKKGVISSLCEELEILTELLDNIKDIKNNDDGDGISSTDNSSLFNILSDSKNDCAVPFDKKCVKGSFEDPYINLNTFKEMFKNDIDNKVFNYIGKVDCNTVNGTVPADKENANKLNKKESISLNNSSIDTDNNNLTMKIDKTMTETINFWNKLRKELLEDNGDFTLTKQRIFNKELNEINNKLLQLFINIKPLIILSPKLTSLSIRCNPLIDKRILEDEEISEKLSKGIASLSEHEFAANEDISEKDIFKIEDRLVDKYNTLSDDELFDDDFINKFGSYSGINNDNIEKDYSYINPDLALIQKTLKNEIASIIKKIKRFAVSTNNDYVNVQTESINSLYNELQSLLLLLDEVEDEINATENSTDTIDKDINWLFELLTNMEDTSPLDDININKASIYKDSKPTNNISVSKEDDKINPKNKPNVIKTPINTMTNKSTALSDESLFMRLLNKNDARKAHILNKITNDKPELDNKINSIIDNINEHYNDSTIDLTMKIDKAMSEIIVSLNNLRNSIIEDTEIPRTTDHSLFIRATYNNIINKLEQLISNNKDTEVECDLVDNDTLEEYKVMSKLDLDDVDETEHNIYNGCLIINSDFIGGIFNNCTIIDTDELGLNKEELFDLIKIIERDDESIG